MNTAVNSMTGFARTDGASDNATWYWEVKSVNGRGLDMRLRLPPGMDALDPIIRAKVQQSVQRGSIQITLQWQHNDSPQHIQLNEDIAEELMQIAQRLQARFGGELPSISTLMGMRGVLETGSSADNDLSDETLLTALEASFDKALDELLKMRGQEGRLLAKTLMEHLDEIEKLTIAARDCPARSSQAAKARLNELVQRLLDSDIRFDADRLHAEAVLLATKADVQEEIDRLFAHIEATRKLLTDTAASGRKLQFLMQEFNREANTLCSKSPDNTLTEIGLELKSVIDRLREQALNVE